MNSLRRTNLANALFYIPRPAVILLPVLLRGLTVILVSGVRAWIASAWVDLLFLCGILLYVLIRWNALRYGLDEELLCIQSGVLRRELRLIPAGRITVVSAVKYLPLRPFGVFLIQADTPAGGVEWADFRLYLSSRDAARLFQSQAEQAPDLPVEHLYRPGNSSVLLLSLFTSNSLGGLLLVAAFVNNLGDIAGRELSRRVFHTLDNIGRLLTFGIPPAAAMLGYLILFGWGVAFLAEFFRNKNFTAIRTGGVLTINRGLFTLRSHAVAVGQINYLDLRETLFSRLLGLGSVYLHVTGILSDRQDIMPIIPVVTRRRLSDILGELLPEFSPAPNQLTHNRGAVIRFLGDALLALAGVGLAVLLLVRRFPQWRRFTLFTGLMALLPCCWFLMVRLMDYRSAGAARVGDTYTLRYSQGFYLHTVMLPRERIVSVSTRQSLLQLLDDRCDVFVTTYSQGKSRHRLRNLDRQEASRMFGFGPLPPRRGLARLLTGLRRK